VATKNQAAELAAKDAIIVTQAEQIATLTALVAELRAEVAELKAQLGQNSKNSSKPPSSDGYASPTRQQQRAAARKAGKQKGDPGTNLAQVDNPDEVVVHSPTHCESCDGDL